MRNLRGVGCDNPQCDYANSGEINPPGDPLCNTCAGIHREGDHPPAGDDLVARPLARAWQALEEAQKIIHEKDTELDRLRAERDIKAQCHEEECKKLWQRIEAAERECERLRMQLHDQKFSYTKEKAFLFVRVERAEASIKILQSRVVTEHDRAEAAERECERLRRLLAIARSFMHDMGDEPMLFGQTIAAIDDALTTPSPTAPGDQK